MDNAYRMAHGLYQTLVAAGVENMSFEYVPERRVEVRFFTTRLVYGGDWRVYRYGHFGEQERINFSKFLDAAHTFMGLVRVGSQKHR